MAQATNNKMTLNLPLARVRPRHQAVFSITLSRLANLRRQQILNGVAFFYQFFFCAAHFLAAKITDLEILNNFPVTVFTNTRE
jgi:hypothetical protein